jgi:hypothetical protein
MIGTKHGPKDNSRRKGIPAQAKEQRRKEAQERQNKYNSLPLAEKLAGAGTKEKAKLLAKQNQKAAK